VTARATQVILETSRLVLRELTLDDAPFILRLLNEPSWLRFIGDRGVRTLDDAVGYLETGPLTSYARNGFGLWCVVAKETGLPVGMCGLIRRATLPEVDVGFAFLPEAWGRGWAREVAAAVLGHARDVVGLKRLLAITSPDNEKSIRVLEHVGLRREGLIRLTGEERDTLLFACDLAP
jgi:RimJ/RimL family protein N-acetyltransferase